MKNKYEEKKAQISIQMFFFILMGAIFVWILFFGYKQISNVNEQLSNQERIEIEKELKHALEFCSDPLNRGSTKIFEYKSNEFNGVCVIGNNPFDSTYGAFGTQIYQLKSATDNVYIIKANIKLNPTTKIYDFSNPSIVGSFYADVGELQTSFCSWKNFKITC